MPLPQQYNDAIMNLGNIGVKVNLMTQQARILKTQRIQTFEILNRLRELIQKLLNLYNNNKDTLQLVYNDIINTNKNVTNLSSFKFLKISVIVSVILSIYSIYILIFINKHIPI